MTTFSDVEREHGKWLSLDHDPNLLRIVFATIVANRYNGPPVWIVLTGPSGSGKTAIVLGASGAAECIARSTFTPAAFASGLTGASMLDSLSGKNLIVRDFSTISEMQAERRTEVGSILRDVYDGEYSRNTGKTAVPVIWKGKIGIIACSTPEATDKYIIGDQSLGQRFLVVRVSTPDRARERIIDTAYDEADKATEMSKALEDTSREFLDDFTQPTVALPKRIGGTVKLCADAIARARSGVVRDRFSREVEYSVGDSMESPGRIVKQMKMLALGLFAIDTPEEDVIRILRRIAADSVPTNRLRALQAISKGFTTRSTVSAYMKVAHQVGSRVIEDLVLLGIVSGETTKASALTIDHSGIREMINGAEK